MWGDLNMLLLVFIWGLFSICKKRKQMYGLLGCHITPISHHPSSIQIFIQWLRLRLTIPCTDENVEQLELSYVASGSVKCYTTLKAVWQLHINSNIDTSCSPAISLLGIYLKRKKTVKTNMSDVLVNVYQPVSGNKALNLEAIANYGINIPILAYFKLCTNITSQNQSWEEIGKIDCGEPATVYHCNMFTHTHKLVLKCSYWLSFLKKIVH